MSISHLAYILDHADADGTHLMVLLALAEYANGEGECYPSIASLARRARRSDRRVQQVLAELIAWGWVEIIHHGGRGLANDYRLDLEAIAKGRPAGSEKGEADCTVSGGGGGGERVKPVTERVKPVTRKGETAIAPQPPRTFREPPRGRATPPLKGGSTPAERERERPPQPAAPIDPATAASMRAEFMRRHAEFRAQQSLVAAS